MIRNAVLLMSAMAIMALAACAGSDQSEPQATTAAQAPAQTGGLAGNQIPDFDMTLVDGSTVSSASLLSAAEPAYLFFFATW